MLKELLLAKLNISAKPKSMSAGRITLQDGRVVTDFLSQYGANPFGGIDEDIRDEAIRFLSEESFALCQPLEADASLKLKSRLMQICGMSGGAVTLSQSGAEAVETALKIARAATGRTRTIALSGGFHGKTQGAVQLTANDEYRRYFRVENGFVEHLDIHDADLFETFTKMINTGTINALVLELVQGEGGMFELPKPLVQGLAKLCKDAGVLLIVDEVQTGFGRTGSTFAFERFNIAPDIVILAKAMGAGLVPISAVVSAKCVCPPEFSVFHSSTFANNAFTCAIARRFLEKVPELEQNVAEKSAYFERKLAELVQRYQTAFSHVSGVGFMRGLHIRPTFDHQSYTANFVWNTSVYAYSIASWMFNHQNILTMPCFSKPSCLRLQPPLMADQAYLDQGIEALGELGKLLSSEQAMSALLMGQSPKALRPRTPNLYGLPGRKATRGGQTRRFIFNMHPLTTESQTLSLPSEFAKMSAQEVAQCKSRIISLSDVVKGFGAPCFDIPSFQVEDKEVSGQLFGLNLTAADMIGLTPLQRSMVIDEMAQQARRFDADVVGLGAFTSVISMGGMGLRSLKKPVTSGSSLTAFAAVQAALQSAKRSDRYGVIGAMGSVGGLVWQMLLNDALKGGPIKGLTLLLNPSSIGSGADTEKKLQRIAYAWRNASKNDLIAEQLPAIGAAFLERLERGDGDASSGSSAGAYALFEACVNEVLGAGFFHITDSNDLISLKACRRIMVATNSATGLNCLEHCHFGTDIFDIGMPSSIPESAVLPEGVQVLTSGILRCELDINTGTGNVVGLPKGIMLGCFAETLTLAATEPEASPLRPMIQLEDAMCVGRLSERVGMHPTTDATLFDTAKLNLGVA